MEPAGYSRGEASHELLMDIGPYFVSDHGPLVSAGCPELLGCQDILRFQAAMIAQVGMVLAMTITPHLFEAYLKCPTKCFLRAHAEAAAGNAYAEWARNQNESYRSAGATRLIDSV